MDKKIQLDKYISGWNGLTAFFVISFIIVSVLVFSGRLDGMDIMISGYMLSIKSSSMDIFMRFVTSIGDPVPVIIIVIGVTWILLLWRKKQMAIHFSSTVLVVYLLNEVLKYLFARPRPEITFLIGVDGYSFPSAHAMVNTAMYGFIAYLLWNGWEKTWMRAAAVLGSVFFIFIIACSRVYFSVHYFSDVLAGVSAGMAVLCFSIAIGSVILSGKPAKKKK